MQNPASDRQTHETAARTPAVPMPVSQAAEAVWAKYRPRLSAAKAAGAAPKDKRARPLPEALKSPEQKMIDKIKRRMAEYPRWYETDPTKQAEIVTEELDRIGARLARRLPEAREPVEVWQIPLSVFNWLVPGGEGPGFVHGALKAWSHAEHFNAANARALTEAQRAHLRQPFLELAPLPLRAVLEALVATGLVITFSEKFIGPELKFLVMRVESPRAS